MTRQEKLVLLSIVLFVLAQIGTFALAYFIAAYFGVSGPPYEKHFWRVAALVWSVVANLGAAIWLAVEARAAVLKAWVWALFGLCFGLLAVALFYLVQLYARRDTVKT